MASEMAIESEVIGIFVEEIGMLAGEGNSEVWLCLGCRYFRLTDAWKKANAWYQ